MIFTPSIIYNSNIIELTNILEFSPHMFFNLRLEYLILAVNGFKQIVSNIIIQPLTTTIGYQQRPGERYRDISSLHPIEEASDREYGVFLNR